MSRAANDLDEVLDAAVGIAREAGLVILGGYRSRPEASYKGDVDLVTSVDLASEQLIHKRLGQRFPDHAVLAEEEGTSGATDAPWRWIVDPLDGTTNFVHGHPFVSVSMALEARGQIVVGVVHAPVLGLTWTACRGAGARRNGEPARVSGVAVLGEALCASGFPYDRRTNVDNNTAEWSRVVWRAQGVRRCGSAAIDLALVADGTYDGYWEKRLNPWDVAAGALLVEEAGGRVTALDGASVPPWPEIVVASNGHLHDELTSLLAGSS